MAKISWDALGEKKYELGIDHGVFYPYQGGEYIGGIPWIGLSSVEDNTGGREATTLYSGGVKTASEYTYEEYAGKIKCYTYPDEFEKYFGEVAIASGIFARQQERPLFGFCYRSLIGNDTEGDDFGYKIHILYNLRVTDVSRTYSTLSDSSDIQTMDISFESFPEESIYEGYDAISEIILESISLNPQSLQTLEEMLYGTETTEPRLPYPDEIIELFEVPEPLPPEWILFPTSLLHPYRTVFPVEQEVNDGD